MIDFAAGDGTTPCQSCQAIGVDCYYSRTVRRYRGASIAKTQNLQRRLGDAERLLQTARLLEQLEAPPPIVEHDDQEIIPVLQQNTADNHEAIAETSRGATISNYGNTRTTDTYQPVNLSPAGLDFGSMPVSQHVASLLDDERQLSHAPEPPSRDEVHGPNSFASICADSGVAWIASRIGASNYATCATSFMSTISRKLKLRKRLSQQRSSDPPMATAWFYTTGKSLPIQC